MTPLSLVPDLVEQVYQAILNAICDGSLPAGERVTQEKLAERLSVSRQPVLQAMLLLKRDGLVTDAGAKGVMVAPLTAETIRQVYQVRAVLDGLAAREAARHRVDLSAALVKAGREAGKGGDVGAMIEADLAFHRAIYAAAGNPLLSHSMERHWHHIRRVMGAVLQRSALRSTIWDEHEAIVAAIAAGDDEQAQRLAIAHCEEAGANLVSRFASQTEHAIEHAASVAPPHDDSPERTRRQA